MNTWRAWVASIALLALTACAQPATPPATATSAALPTAAPTETRSPTPRPARAPTHAPSETPVLTPTPTLPFGEGNVLRLDKLLPRQRDLPDCELPCFLGLEIGQATSEDALAWYESVFEVTRQDALCYSDIFFPLATQDTTWYCKDWTLVDYTVVFDAALRLPDAEGSQTLKRVTFSWVNFDTTQAEIRLSARTIVDIFGAPDEMWFRAESIPLPPWQAEVLLVMVYEDGLVFYAEHPVYVRYVDTEGSSQLSAEMSYCLDFETPTYGTLYVTSRKITGQLIEPWRLGSVSAGDAPSRSMRPFEDDFGVSPEEVAARLAEGETCFEGKSIAHKPVEIIE